MTDPVDRNWFQNCGGYSSRHILSELRSGIERGLLDEQDEYGMTALSLAAASSWQAGVEELLRAGANTELRVFRTGETALYIAVLNQNEPIIQSLMAGGANPDAANHWGITPRKWRPGSFEQVPERERDMPEPQIQNAEHLADHHHPHFKIPSRHERETLQPGQAVDLYVFGPKSEDKQDTVKVRVSTQSGHGQGVLYVAAVETPIEQTHLRAGTTAVAFGPENVASVYVPRGNRHKKGRRSV